MALSLKVKRIIATSFALVGTAGLIGGGFFFYKKFFHPATSEHGEHAEHDKANADHEKHANTETDAHHTSQSEADCEEGKIRSLGDWFASIEKKITKIYMAEHENERLRFQNAKLLAEMERIQFDERTKVASQLAHETSQALKGRTGSKVGRVPSSINYVPPADLMPVHLYALAISYYNSQRKEDIEKSAVILTQLTTSETEEGFKNEKTLIFTGIAWYQLDHFQLADQFFADAFEFVNKEKPKEIQATETGAELKKGESVDKYRAQALLWRALAARKMGQIDKAQTFLKTLLDKFPQAQELDWVNESDITAAGHGSKQAKSLERSAASVHADGHASGHANSIAETGKAKDESHNEDHEDHHGSQSNHH